MLKQKSILIAGTLFIASILFLFGFRSKPEDLKSEYAIADFDSGDNLLNKFRVIHISYTDGTKEDIKYDHDASSSEIPIIAISKIEAKGYTLQLSNASIEPGGSLFNRLIFKKK